MIDIILVLEALKPKGEDSHIKIMPNRKIKEDINSRLKNNPNCIRKET